MDDNDGNDDDSFDFGCDGLFSLVDGRSDGEQKLFVEGMGTWIVAVTAVGAAEIVAAMAVVM